MIVHWNLHYRVLNHEPSRKLYIDVLKKVDVSIKNTILKILKEIKNDNPVRFEMPVNEVLSSLKK